MVTRRRERLTSTYLMGFGKANFSPTTQATGPENHLLEWDVTESTTLMAPIISWEAKPLGGSLPKERSFSSSFFVGFDFDERMRTHAGNARFK